VSFDALRRISQVTNPAPFSQQKKICSYDANGNKLSIERGDGVSPWQVYSWTYTLSDKESTAIDPSGNTSSKSYDDNDRIQSTQDAEGRIYHFAYDQLNRVISVIDPTDVTSETRSFSPNGMLTSIIDASGNEAVFTFDGFDRSDKTIYPAVSPLPATFEQNLLYDKNGNVRTHVSRLGQTNGTFTGTYDSWNRLVTKSPAGQPSESYIYDFTNKLSSITDSTLGTFTRSYDTAGRFFKEQNPDGKAVTLTLDLNGNVSRLTYPDGYFVDRA
jgi:YD repeat-containing protein